VVQGLEGQGTRISSATLAPSSRGKRLVWRGSTRTTVDGPFVESKELTVADALEIDVRPLG